MTGQQNLTIELTLQRFWTEPATVGYWDTSVASAGVHRNAHLTSWSITIHTGKYTQTAHNGLPLCIIDSGTLIRNNMCYLLKRFKMCYSQFEVC